MNRIRRITAVILTLLLGLNLGITAMAMDETALKKAENFILIGDSRVCGIGYAVGAEIQDADLLKEEIFVGKKDDDYIIGKGSQGCQWLRDVAIPLAGQRMTPVTTVVIWMGTNDLSDADQYAGLINSLPCRVMVVACGRRIDKEAEKVSRFNTRLHSLLKPGVVWMDLGQTIADGDFLEDGVHLTNEGYEKVYQVIKTAFEALPVDYAHLYEGLAAENRLHSVQPVSGGTVQPVAAP